MSGFSLQMNTEKLGHKPGIYSRAWCTRKQYETLHVKLKLPGMFFFVVAVVFLLFFFWLTALKRWSMHRSITLCHHIVCGAGAPNAAGRSACFVSGARCWYFCHFLKKGWFWRRSCDWNPGLSQPFVLRRMDLARRKRPITSFSRPVICIRVQPGKEDFIHNGALWCSRSR